MPNRLIKETIRTSKKINSLSDFEFRTWAYLVTYVDDYGRGSADPEILKGFVFPRRKEVREQDIQKALAALERTGSILLYEVAGEPYFCFPNWSEHQRIQTKKSKYPAPSDSDISRWVTVGHGESPPESNPNPESNPKDYCAEPQAAGAPPVISLPLNDGTFFDVSENDRAKWSQLYPNVDVLQQLRNMAGWCDSNPTKRKTRGGIKRFITAWLAREQDKGGKAPQNKPFVYDYGNTEGSL
nr:MAG TPA: replisome organizer [Caudoviricetes sp.]